MCVCVRCVCGSVAGLGGGGGVVFIYLTCENRTSRLDDSPVPSHSITNSSEMKPTAQQFRVLVSLSFPYVADS